MQKTFSLDEANESLVFVKPILQDIQRTWRELNILKENVAKEEAAETIQRHLVRLEYHLKELLQVGCICKDFDRGLVDFPCIHDGQLIYLCFSEGEKKVSHWHSVNGDFNHRESIDEEFIFIEALKRKTDPTSSLAS